MSGILSEIVGLFLLLSCVCVLGGSVVLYFLVEAWGSFEEIII